MLARNSLPSSAPLTLNNIVKTVPQGRQIVQASHNRPGFKPRVIHVEFAADKVSLGRCLEKMKLKITE
jgi:hypothetical protein